MALSRTKEDVIEHLQLETPRWDTKVRCACGAEFTSRCEFWRHQALAYEALVSSGFDPTYVDPIIVNIEEEDVD